MKKAYLISGNSIASCLSLLIARTPFSIRHMKRIRDSEKKNEIVAMRIPAFKNIATSRGEPVYCWIDAETQSLVWYTDADVVVANPNSSKMFTWAKAVEDMDLPEIMDTHLVQDADHMFKGCTFLKALDLSSWRTEKLDTMRCLFESCCSLTELNCHGWDLSGMTTPLYKVFAGCRSLKELDVTDWRFPDVNKVALPSTFMGCESLEEIPIDSWDLHNVTDYSNCFAGCTNLKHIPIQLQHCDPTEECISLHEAFRACSSLTDVDLICSSSVNLSSAFDDCTGLKNFRMICAGKDVDMTYAYCGCKELSKVEIKTTEPVQGLYLYAAFALCKELKELDLSGIAVSDGELRQSWNKMVTGCTKLEEITFPKIGTGIKTASHNLVEEISGGAPLPNLKWIMT